MAEAKRSRSKKIIRGDSDAERPQQSCDDDEEPECCNCIVPSRTRLCSDPEEDDDEESEQNRRECEEYLTEAFANFRRVAHSMVPSCKSYEDARYCLALVNELETEFERCNDFERKECLLDRMRKLLTEIKWITDMGRPLAKNEIAGDCEQDYSTTYQSHFQHPSTHKPAAPPPRIQRPPTYPCCQPRHACGNNQCPYHNRCCSTYYPYNNSGYMVYTAVAYQQPQNGNACMNSHQMAMPSQTPIANMNYQYQTMPQQSWTYGTNTGY